MIAAAALVSLGISVYFWRRSLGPIVTAAVKTHTAGSDAITYDLVVSVVRVIGTGGSLN
jgi:hypothetical protein